MCDLAVAVERTDAREWSDAQTADLFSDGFPPFITADKRTHPMGRHGG
jgi:hypothetical protein